MRAFGPAVLLLATFVTPAVSQTVAQDLAKGDSVEAMHPDSALAYYKAALAIDSTNYAALWRAAEAQSDIGKQIVGEHDYTVHVRDSVYEVARDYAEGAVRADSMGAEGHCMLAIVLGRLSRTKGGKERVQYARIIYDEASRALQLDSTLDKAEHVLGAWHAEVKRLSGITKFFAKTFLGAGFMDRASWDSAVVHLKRAIALNPTDIYHHLELAEVYIDIDQYDDARAQLQEVQRLPVGDVMDPAHKKKAAELLADIKGKS